MAGVAAAAIPVLIHLLNRWRHRRVTWAAVLWLEAALQRRARRIRLTSWLLLLLRVAVVLLLGLLISRPFFSGTSLGAISGARSHHVIILDNSGSMNARLLSVAGADGADGTEITRFDRAKDIGRKLLDSFPQGDSVSLVTASRPVQSPLRYECFDGRQARDAWDALHPSWGGTDLASAFHAAEEIFQDSQALPDNRFVYLVSDQCHHAWEPNPGKLAAPARPGRGEGSDAIRAAESLQSLASLVLIPVPAHRASSLDRASGPNPAITSAALRASLAGTTMPDRVDLVISNGGSGGAEMVCLDGACAIRIRLDDRILPTGQTMAIEPLSPAESRALQLAINIDQPGIHRIAIELLNSGFDAIEGDNHRYLTVEQRENIPVLLLDGEAGEHAYEGRAFYIRTALATVKSRSGEPRFRSEVRRSAEWDPGAPGGSPYPWIVLCGVTQLTDDQWIQLDGYVKRGGSLLIFAGSGMDVEQYHAHAYRDGDGWLPARFALPEGSETLESPPLRLRPEPKYPPPLDVFDGHENSSLFDANAYLVIRLDPASLHRAGAETMLSWNNHEPALISKRYGRGRCLFFGTSANMEWTNLPAKGDFVTFILALASELAMSSQPQGNVSVGEPIEVAMRPAMIPGTGVPGEQGLQIQDPQGESVDAHLDCQDDACTLITPPTTLPGYYSIRLGDEMHWIPVNLPPEEAMLGAWSAADVVEHLGPDTKYVADVEAFLRADPQGKAAELAMALAHVLMILLVFETWLAAPRSNASGEGLGIGATR